MTKTTFVIYTDRKGETRWRATRKGRVVAESGEGYRRAKACWRSLLRFVDSIVGSNWNYDNQTKTEFEV